LDVLIRAGCIAVSPGQYPTLSLTPLGQEVVHRRKALPLAMPARTAAKPKAARRTKAEARAAPAEQAVYDTAVFDALRRWRREKAAAMGDVPAYVIYPDATLKALAGSLPKTPEELLEVRGIGPAKASRFGAETLAVIRAARA
jgi:ATP-dependent DNA helicase RecQ